MALRVPGGWLLQRYIQIAQEGGWTEGRKDPGDSVSEM